MKPRRAIHPRVNCIAPDCKRGTTRLRPHSNGMAVEWICAVHWRAIPKAWRQRLSLFRRRYFAAVRKGDSDMQTRAGRAFWRCWDRIARLARNPESVTTGEGLPMGMADELRRMGL